MKAYTEHAAVNKGSVFFFPSIVLVLVLCYSYKKGLNFVLFFLLKITAISSMGSDTHLHSCIYY